VILSSKNSRASTELLGRIGKAIPASEASPTRRASALSEGFCASFIMAKTDSSSDDDEAGDGALPPSSADYYRLLLPQCLVGLIDAISFMVVAPSIVFYVLAMGGTKEQYGMVLSIFSFASFSFKPILGYWCDKSSGFRVPYLSSIAVASLGGLVYFLASAFPSRVAVPLISLGRFLGGVGAANSTLGFTYIAQVVPPNQMTKANAALSMVRVLGMATAPALNFFVEDISGSIFGFKITPLNSIGLILMGANLISFVVMYLMLEEPPESTKPASSSVDDVDGRSWKFWKAIFSIEIMVPVISILGMNANFQLLETGLAPAGSDAMGWGPFEISSLFGFNAICIFVAILLTFQLSAMGVTNTTLLITGLVFSIVGYTLIYLWWSASVAVWQFVTPVIVSCMAFPFMGAPTRSLFTLVVAGNKYLSGHQGTMQALLSMAASVAGFAAPGLIAAFVLRTPDEVAASPDHREFTPWALFAPVFSIITLAGVFYLIVFPPVPDAEFVGDDDEEEEMVPGERMSLLSPEDLLIGVVPNEFHPRTEAHRRHSVALMGIPQITLHGADHSLSEEDAPAFSRKSFFV